MSETVDDLVFDNVAVAVTDMDQSITWYKRVFGFEVAYRTYSTAVQADFVLLEISGLRIELLSKPAIERSPEITPESLLSVSGLKAIVFRTRDLEAVTARFERLDLTFVWKLRSISADGLRATMIRDPDGNLINVLSYPDTR